MAKEGLLLRTNSAINLLNLKVGIELSKYELSQKKVKELEYIFLNASQAYANQMESPMFVNNSHGK